MQKLITFLLNTGVPVLQFDRGGGLNLQRGNHWKESVQDVTKVVRGVIEEHATATVKTTIMTMMMMIDITVEHHPDAVVTVDNFELFYILIKEPKI